MGGTPKRAEIDPGTEFSTEPPRPLPEFAHRSRYVRARQSEVWTFAIIGSSFLVTQGIPFVQTLSLYVPMLGFLGWIGSTLLALAAALWLRNVATQGSLKYLIRGMPLKGRVLQVGVSSEGTSKYPSGRFVAQVDFRNPETHTKQTNTIEAPDSYATKELSRMDAGVRRGDVVKLVYLPGQLEKTLQLYGWLGINPDEDLIQKDHLPIEPLSPLTALLRVIGITCGALCILALVFVIGRYSVVHDAPGEPYFIGIFLASIPCVIALCRRVDHDDETTSATLKLYLRAILGGVFLGTMIGSLIVGFLNGFFDQSPPHLNPIKITRCYSVSHKFLIRSFELEYQPFPVGKSGTKTVSAETLALFQEDSLGVIDIGNGWLGMPWVRDVHPLLWEKVNSDEIAPIADEIRYQLPGNGHPMRIVPKVLSIENAFSTLPEAFRNAFRKQMIFQLKIKLMATVIEPNQP